MTTWTGAPITRLEDEHFLTGDTRFVDDISPPGLVHAAMVRSPVAAAVFDGVDISSARSTPGVVAVLTAADLAHTTPLRPVLHRPQFVATEMPLLATNCVRYVGEPVALVLAETRSAAEDAAELVWVDYDEAPAVSSLDDALAVNAQPVHPEAPDNLLLDLFMFQDPALEDIFTRAAVVVDGVFDSGRVTAAPMEGRGVVAEWDRRDGRLTLHMSTQVPHMVRTAVADTLGLAENLVRVVAPDVGGGFGQKCAVGREEIAVAAAAVLTRRPVKWVEDRRENLLAAFQGHEQRHHVRAGFDAEGTILGLSTDIWCDVGAYHCYPFTGGVEPLMAATEMPGPYRLQHYSARTRAVATNKPPMAPYRGVSRPQITLAMERIMDKAAFRLEKDPAEIRRRNLIRRDEFPYRGATGILYDEGSYIEALEGVVAAAGYESLRQEQRAANASPGNGQALMGVGLSVFSERTAYGTPVFGQRLMGITPGYETAHVRIDPSGGATVLTGTVSHGQGHATTLAQMVADRLLMTPTQVRVVQGDTDAIPYGWGTFASRSVVLSGDAATEAADRLVERLTRIAAHLLEAAPDDVVFEGGRFGVRGVPESGMSLTELARSVYHAPHLLPPDERAELEEWGSSDPPGTFSNAAHLAVVEIDPATWEVSIVRYLVTEDCGVMINPLIVDGQISGGVAQGIGAALYERLVFDDEGQPLAASFMDYLVPTATEVPPIEITHLETPSTVSATGAKGMGEGGTIGAPAAILNAVNDALSAFGVEIDRIPVTPDDIARAVAAR
jgi:aerobic carbon-monoxide dehydrogenase large subunit